MCVCMHVCVCVFVLVHGCGSWVCASYADEMKNGGH